VSVQTGQQGESGALPLTIAEALAGMIERGIGMESDEPDLYREVYEAMAQNPRDVYEAIAGERGVPFVDLSVYKPEPSAVYVVPEHVARANNCLPLKKDHNVLFVAMADIDNRQAQDTLRLVSHCRIRPVLAAPEPLRVAIERAYSQPGHIG
jgi:type IV pilus assembly protein PilB